MSSNDSQNDENCRFAAKPLSYNYRITHISETMRVLSIYRLFELPIFCVENKIRSSLDQSASGDKMLFRSKIKRIERNRLILRDKKRSGE